MMMPPTTASIFGQVMLQRVTSEVFLKHYYRLIGLVSVGIPNLRSLNRYMVKLFESAVFSGIN